VFVDDGVLHTCVDKHRGQARLVDARQVNAAMADAVTACKACDRTIEIGIHEGTRAKDLVGASSAIRRIKGVPVIASIPRCTTGRREP
jgi:hypothetical protein